MQLKTLITMMHQNINYSLLSHIKDVKAEYKFFDVKQMKNTKTLCKNNFIKTKSIIECFTFK